MKLNDVNVLFQSAKQIGILPTLLPSGNNIHVSIPLGKNLCSKCIDELELSVRSLNGLKRCGVMTVGELTDIIMSEGGISKVRNLGKKSISEIKSQLLQFAYQELREKEQLQFWQKFIELNADDILAENESYYD